jgi:hypothetical protein
MGEGDGGLGALVDAHERLRDPDPDQPQAQRRRGDSNRGGFECLAPRGLGRPVAVTLPAASELLGVPAARVRRAAEAVEPYTHANGSPRWSLMLLERALAQPKRTGAGSAWRGKSIHQG